MGMSRGTKARAARAATVAIAVATWVSAAPAIAGAQEAEPGDSGNGFEVVGHIGAFTPLAKLADSGDTLRAEFSTKVAFGAELDYWFGNVGIGLAGNYSNPDLTLQIVEGDVGFPTSIPLGTADVWMAAANVMWRPSLRGSAAVVRPYLGVGPGIVKVTYPSSAEFAIGDETRFALSVLAGAHLEIGSGWFVRLDLRDYISKLDTEPFAETKTQHDLITSIGIGYGFH